MAYGAVGDGVTNNNLPFQGATAGAGVAGGLVRLPCGTFKITYQAVQNIPAGKTVDWQGSGNCTVLYVSGAAGPLFNFGNDFSSASVKDMSIVTDAPGTYTGMTWTYTTGQSGAASVPNYLDRVNFLGSDNQSTDNNYWGTAFSSVGPSNINVDEGLCEPSATGHVRGTCYSLAGYGSGSFPFGVVYNFKATVINYANIGINYGNYIQGVILSSVNMVGVNYGVQTTASETGLDELIVTASQFNCNIYCIDIEDPQFNDPIITGNLFIVSGGSAMKIQGVGYIINDNTAGGVNNTAKYFADVLSSYASGGLFANNSVGNFEYGFHMGASVNAELSFTENRFINFPLLAGTNAVVTVAESGGAVTSLTLQSATVSSSASTVTWTGSNLTAGQGVFFTGTLPSGVTANTVYYVLAAGLTANTFEIGATAGGAAIVVGTGASFTATVGGVYPYVPVAVIQGVSCAGVTSTLTTTPVVVAGSTGYEVTAITLGSGGSGCTGVPSIGIQASEKYYVDPTATSVFISDHAIQNYEDLPFCQSGMQYSQMTVANGTPATFNASMKGGSSAMLNAFCEGTWLAH